jgi:hypothetical protein
VLSRNKIDSIKRAAQRDDWSDVGAIFLDLCLEAETDKFLLDSLAPYVRLRDGERLIQVVDESCDAEGGDGS